MVIDQDGPLAVARRRLENAVAALADPVPTSDGGVCRWSDPVYTCLRRELSGGRVIRRGVRWTSKLPCRVDVLALLIDIDVTVGGWEPDGKGTLDRLHQLAGRGWRPQDCGLIDGYCDRLAWWAVSAAELLGPDPRVYLRQPCPRCGASHAYRRDSAGDWLRVWALRVSEEGCRCQACQAYGGPDRFEWLARLLEPAPPA